MSFPSFSIPVTPCALVAFLLCLGLNILSVEYKIRKPHLLRQFFTVFADLTVQSFCIAFNHVPRNHTSIYKQDYFSFFGSTADVFKFYHRQNQCSFPGLFGYQKDQLR